MPGGPWERAAWPLPTAGEPLRLRYYLGSHEPKGLPRWLSSQEPACSVGTIRDLGSIPGSGGSPGGGHGNLLQFSCLENPMFRGAQWATVLGVA